MELSCGVLKFRDFKINPPPHSQEGSTFETALPKCEPVSRFDRSQTRKCEVKTKSSGHPYKRRWTLGSTAQHSNTGVGGIANMARRLLRPCNIPRSGWSEGLMDSGTVRACLLVNNTRASPARMASSNSESQLGEGEGGATIAIASGGGMPLIARATIPQYLRPMRCGKQLPPPSQSPIPPFRRHYHFRSPPHDLVGDE